MYCKHTNQWVHVVQAAHLRHHTQIHPLLNPRHPFQCQHNLDHQQFILSVGCTTKQAMMSHHQSGCLNSSIWLLSMCLYGVWYSVWPAMRITNNNNLAIALQQYYYLLYAHPISHPSSFSGHHTRTGLQHHGPHTTSQPSWESQDRTYTPHQGLETLIHLLCNKGKSLFC